MGGAAGEGGMSYVYEPHKPGKRKGIPWPVCCYCGLVYLNNEFTRWSVKKGCNSREHPGYEAQRRGAA